MTNEHVQDFLNEHNYDVRITRNGRWMDQKCTMDVVCFVADCILDYLRNGGEQPFTSPTIWHSDYAKENVQAIYNKPDPENYSAHDEFNKFYRQPMKMLAAANVLSEEKRGSTIYFTVRNREVLEFIAMRERNAFVFLCNYIEKTLRDSGLWPSFERFFERQNKDEYHVLKDRFSEFTINNTPINTEREVGRIFTKVLNILAFKYRKRGTERGHISDRIITMDKIVYNTTNWRDDLSGKEKNVARSDFEQTATQDYYQYRVNRAMRNLRRFNDEYNNGNSEVRDVWAYGAAATNIHHIFPQSYYPQLAAYLENLIALTSAQHMQHAHPEGNTQQINRDYQYFCLISKTDSIKHNLVENRGEPVIYSFNDFLYVLATGLNDHGFEQIPENDFNCVLSMIERAYA